MAFGLQFDGVNDLVNISSPVTIGFGNDGSITVPFKRTDTSNGQALFGDQSGTSNICQILNNNQVFLRVNSSSVTLNLTTALVLNGEYVFKFKRSSDTWSLVDDLDVSLAPETVMNKNAISIDQIGAFNGGTLFHGRIDGFIVEELGTELQSLVNTTGTGSVWPDSIGSADGTLVNFPTDDSQWIDLGGSGVTVTAATANYNYSGITGSIDLTGEIIVTGQTANYDYAAITASIELGSEIIVTGQTANYNYTGINGSIELTGLITVTGQTANYDYDGIAADITLQGSIIVTASAANYDYNALNGTIILQGPITINPKNIIRVKRKSNTIRIKRKSNTIIVR